MDRYLISIMWFFWSCLFGLAYSATKAGFVGGLGVGCLVMCAVFLIPAED